MLSQEAIELFILVGPLNVITVFIGLMFYDFVVWLFSLIPKVSVSANRSMIRGQEE